MPGIYLPERQDDSDAYREWLVRQDESEERTARQQVWPSPFQGDEQGSIPWRFAIKRIYIGLRAALIAFLLLIVVFVVGRVEADVYEAAQPPLCLDLEG